MHALATVTAAAMLIGTPIFGMKLPQKDNPFYWRKKYATQTSLYQMQKVAMIEYGAKLPKGPDTNCMITKNGFTQVGHGIRYELDNYDDLIC